MMFWSRALLAQEQAFVVEHFGGALRRLQPQLRLYVRRVGDCRRALSFNGGRIALPRDFFRQQDPRQSLRLEHPQVAAIFAHELLHQWQRLHGRAVTREALGLQLQAICLRRNPYHYPRAVTAEAMLACFRRSSVEQQGQMWEDYVQAAVQGEYLPCMELVAQHVRGA